MEGFSVDKKRNIILVSHARAGKSTLAESMLFTTKTVSRKGTIEEGNTVSDYTDEEKSHKVSTQTSLLHCTHKEHFIQIIDTPGYADFVGEVVAPLTVADAAIVLVDATSGIEVGTEYVWDLLEKNNIPRLIFINKTDKENTDFKKTLEELRQNLSKSIIAIENPLSAENIEAIAESNDALLDRYLEGKEIPQDELKKALKEAVDQGKVFPAFGGSAFNNKGVPELLDAIVEYLPSPQERAPVKAKDEKTGQEKQLELSPTAPLCGFVFKTISDPFVGQLSLIKLYSGTLAANTSFYNITKKTRERFSQIYSLQGKEQKSIPDASCGDIIAIAKLKDTVTNDTIGIESLPVLFDPIIFPEPIFSASAKPKTRADEEKISSVLSRLTAEDHTFKISRDTQTKELIFTGMGDQHINIMVERMRKRYHVEVDMGTPKVPYKETITKSAKTQVKYKKQSGGRGQYADVWIELNPLPRGGEFEFVDKIVGGAIPRNFIPSVEKGVRSAMLQGALSGYPVVDFRVILYDGSYHDVDSSDIAFQIAGRMAFRKAMLEAGVVLLEPIMNVEITITEDAMGAISGDINSRRGRVMGMEARGKYQVVKAQVPLAEMFSYAADLRSMTGGRGNYSMSFSHSEIVPHKLAQDIIAKYQQTKKEEQEE